MNELRAGPQFSQPNNSIPPRSRLPTDITGSSTNQNMAGTQASKYEMYKNSTKKLQQKQRTNNYMGYNIESRDMQTTTQSQPISQQNNYIYKA